MKDFNELTLADVALNEKGSIISGPFGSNISSKFFVKQGVPVIRGNNLTINNKSKFIDSDFVYVSKEKAKELNCFAICEDIIFTAAGTIGQVGIIEKNSKYQSYVISNKQMRVRLDKRKVNPYYVYYWLSSSWVTKGLIKKNTGSTVPLINLGIIKSIKINLPKERYLQDNIANLLNNLDKKIELNNRINTELEAMAKTLYDYWFVQFDFPNEEGKPYKSSGGKMVYNNILKREIPEGWETNTIAQVFSTSLGGTPSTHNKDYWHNADIHWISSAETTFFPIISSEQKITLKGLEHSAACLLPKGTVVISIVRYIRPSILGVDAATNQSVVGIKETDIFKSSFIYPYLCGEVPKFMALRTGAQQPHINKKVIDDNIIIIPINSVLELYYKIANPIFDKIMTVAFENKHLIELRDFLLPMLMNGQVIVK
ncbi:MULTISPECIES: restriction endonuclease subunit S [Gilliamella]|uniref:Restriction endonuclease subunit S n=1 Tax=Gilliamella apicola TaxID=1196095 RepID=A0A556RUK9_9GAMM|nr:MULTISPECIES: restriction endonuclease subunit S [Gilliamella]MBI0096568.1 restriction endonuclease subunit S [Gilliamella sp. W8136]TSJ92590.1 restriction endonuclease subunit S [Gilliamella apicola]